MQKYLGFANAVGKSDSFNNVKNETDSFRNDLYKYDRSLLENTGLKIEYDDLDKVPDGRFSISYKGVDFDCMYKRNTDSDTLYVVFSGTRPANAEEPTFKRWSYYAYMDGSMLNIDDPMCMQNKKLTLGWYYGTENKCYCDYIAEIVSAFAEKNGFKNIIFFASSGGGYAALYCACKIPGSTAAVINPQIKLSIYTPDAKRFQQLTGLDLEVEDSFGRNDLGRLIRQSNESKFLVISNSASTDDVAQINYLCSVLETQYHYGLTKLAPNIISWVYEANLESPHNAQESPQIFFAIEYLIKNFEKADMYSDIYLIFNEFWYNHFRFVNSMKRKDQFIDQSISDIGCFPLKYSKEAFEKNTVYHGCDVTVPSSEHNPFNFKVIFNSFEPETIYELTLGGISITEGSCEEINVIIKNPDIDMILLQKKVSAFADSVIRFKTGKSTDNLEMRIYSGIAGSTQGIALKIQRCILVKETISVKAEPYTAPGALCVSDSKTQMPGSNNASQEHTYTEDEYLYIRGFLIKHNNGRPAAINKSWKSMTFGNRNEYVAFYDYRVRTAKSVSEKSGSYVVLLGTFMNTETFEDDISVIAGELTQCLEKSMDAFWDYVDILNGRHIIIYGKDGNVNLFTDATGMRSTYYCTKKLLISSHYNLINDIEECAVHPFYEEFTDLCNRRTTPGNTTPFLGIKMLIPNHFVSLLDGCSITRFFPREAPKNLSIDEICDYISKNIRGQYNKLVEKHDVLHSLTAGSDSRICLAAATDVRDKVTFFTYHNKNLDMNDFEKRDREINFLFASDVAKRENLKHIEVFFGGPYPEEMCAIMQKNHYHKHNRLIEQMRKSYNFTPDTIHMRSSIVEMMRNTSHVYPATLSTDDMAHKSAKWSFYYRSEIIEKAVPYFNEFIEECDLKAYERFNINYELAHYWEQLMPVWINASALTDNDMLCDTYMLFNVRKILEMGFSLTTYWRSRDVVFREVINRLWPTLLEYKLPNKQQISYDLIDRENSGCVSFKSAVYKSGSFADKDRKVEYYAETREFGSCFGFSASEVLSGDFVKVELEHAVSKDISYYYEFNILTPYLNYAPYSEIRYDILVNDTVVYKACCTDFNNRLNSIIYGFKAEKTQTNKVTIRLVATKDTHGNDYNGVINIKSVTLRQEWVKKFEKPVISSTRDRYLALE